MTRELFTTWGDYQTAVDHALSMAKNSLRIYDHDLTQLKLESSERITRLRHFLQGNPKSKLTIAVRHAEFFQNHCPQLIEMLRLNSERVAIIETSDNFSHLRDNMLLVDAEHALIRFDQDLPRCKLICDDTEETAPYLLRFEEIWHEGGTPISGTTIGL